MVQCAGCYQETPNGEYLRCTLCSAYYDLICANIPESHFYTTMTANHKSNWKCQDCVCKMPKENNIDTPIKQPIQSSTQIETIDANVTLRQKPTVNPSLREYTIHSPQDDISVDEVIGNTITNTINEYIMSGNGCTNIKENENLTLNNISLLLDAKLDKIKSSILDDVKQTIQTEIKNAIRNIQNEPEYSVNHTPTVTHRAYQEEINQVNKKIESIQEKLQDIENTKKIVIYGLIEEHRETETNLYERTSRLFYDIMGIDIDPYIEDIKRIGKIGNRRPLAIELISKRMTNYILENSNCFKNTGITVGKYMDRKKKRNELRQNLIKARKNGDYAVIRNNKLFINGNEFISPNPNDTTTEISGKQNPMNNKIIEDLPPDTERGNTPTSHSSTQPNPSIPSQKVNKSNNVTNKTFR